MCDGILSAPVQAIGATCADAFDAPFIADGYHVIDLATHELFPEVKGPAAWGGGAFPDADQAALSVGLTSLAAGSGDFTSAAFAASLRLRLRKLLRTLRGT